MRTQEAEVVATFGPDPVLEGPFRVQVWTGIGWHEMLQDYDSSELAIREAQYAAGEIPGSDVQLGNVGRPTRVVRYEVDISDE